MRRAAYLLFILVFTGIWTGTFLGPVPAVAEDAANDAQFWVGTWTGTISTLDSHSTKPTESPITIVIAAADIGKSWNIRGDHLTKDESAAGVQTSTTLTRTGPNACSLVADGIGSGRGGFTRHITGSLTKP